MLVLDLFCGTKSLKNVVEEKGFEYIGLDIEKKHNPEILIDFLEWDYTEINPNIIWASPDCSVFSMASRSVHFNKDKKPVSEKALLHLKIIDKLKKCINYHLERNPDLIYFIENPTAKLTWFLKEYPRFDLHYCRYGYERMKPTTIWTNKSFIPLKCKRGNMDCHHEKAPRGSMTGIQGLPKFERYKIPKELLEVLFGF